MGEKILINLRVDEQQKQSWEDYIEESGRYSSLSELIRASVETEISDDSGSTQFESPALSNDVQELKDEIERVRKDVRWLKNQKQDAVDVSEIAQELFTTLEPLPESPVSTVPDEVDDPEAFHKREAANQVIRPSDEDDTRSPQTVEYFADELGVDEETIRDAIEHLQDQFLPVVTVELDGQTYYFKEE